MQHMGSATKLQYLELTWLREATAAVLEGLPQPQQLTFLQLNELQGHVTASTCPEFSTLTALEHLILEWGSPRDIGEEALHYWTLQPSLVAGMCRSCMCKGCRVDFCCDAA